MTARATFSRLAASFGLLSLGLSLGLLLTSP
jgi:hypothetical protein